jgi:hypothetical protein
MTAMRTAAVAATAIAALASAGCSSDQIVTTDDAAKPPAAQSPSASPTPVSDTHLANAFDYVGYPPGGARYYFTTPSGRWACAIVPHLEAGCHSATNWQGAIGVAGAPDSVPDSAGQAETPNAVVIEREAAEPRFVVLDQPEFALDPGPANVLPFNRTLAVAGFRCNVQEATGVSCLSERSGKGFTFSDDGLVPQYTDVPANAP